MVDAIDANPRDVRSPGRLLSEGRELPLSWDREDPATDGEPWDRLSIALARCADSGASRAAPHPCSGPQVEGEETLPVLLPMNTRRLAPRKAANMMISARDAFMAKFSSPLRPGRHQGLLARLMFP